MRFLLKKYIPTELTSEVIHIKVRTDLSKFPPYYFNSIPQTDLLLLLHSSESNNKFEVLVNTNKQTMRCGRLLNAIMLHMSYSFNIL